MCNIYLPIKPKPILWVSQHKIHNLLVYKLVLIDIFMEFKSVKAFYKQNCKYIEY